MVTQSRDSILNKGFPRNGQLRAGETKIKTNTDVADAECASTSMVLIFFSVA